MYLESEQNLYLVVMTQVLAVVTVGFGFVDNTKRPPTSGWITAMDMYVPNKLKEDVNKSFFLKKYNFFNGSTTSGWITAIVQ